MSHQWEQPNKNKPLWMRKSEDVTNAECASSRNSLSNDREDHLSVKHSSVEGELELCALPSTSLRPRKKETTSSFTSVAFSSWMIVTNRIQSEFCQGRPGFEGSPSEHFSEILQQNNVFFVLKKNLVKKSLEMCAEIAEKKDGDKKFYEQFGKCLKLGIHEDFTNRTKIAELFKCKTSKSGDEQISLKEYVDRMKEGENDIHFITRESIAVVSSSPFWEDLRKKGLEVLDMVDPG